MEALMLGVTRQITNWQAKLQYVLKSLYCRLVCAENLGLRGDEWEWTKFNEGTLWRLYIRRIVIQAWRRPNQPIRCYLPGTFRVSLSKLELLLLKMKNVKRIPTISEQWRFENISLYLFSYYAINSWFAGGLCSVLTNCGFCFLKWNRYSPARETWHPLEVDWSTWDCRF